MRKIKSMIALSILSLSIPAMAGGIVANGGNTLWCRPGKTIQNSGYYSLDFLSAIGRGMTPSQFVHVNNWKESAARIRGLLAKSNLSMAKNFDVFVADTQSIFNQRLITDSYKWIPSHEKITTLSYNGSTEDLPTECLLPAVIGLPSEVSFYQTVVRTKTPIQTEIYFKFDELIFLNLSQNPLQLSMMLFHEWLWNFSHNIDTVMTVNQFMHTKTVDSFSEAEIENIFKDLKIARP